MKSMNPTQVGLPRIQQQWAQTVHETVNGGIDQGVPTGKDSTGNYSTFNKGNSDGQLIRIGASGTTDNPYAWSTSGVGININHTLGRQPIGAHLVSSNKDLRIWIPSTPTDTTIVIAPSDATSYATVYVF